MRNNGRISDTNLWGWMAGGDVDDSSTERNHAFRYSFIFITHCVNTNRYEARKVCQIFLQRIIAFRGFATKTSPKIYTFS